MAKLKLLEFRDLGGLDPKGQAIEAIYNNFEALFNALNENRSDEKPKKRGPKPKIEE